MGINDKKKIYEAEDLAPGKQLIFAATGVTDGALMKGVRFFGEGNANFIRHHDAEYREGPIHRQHSPGQGSGCEGPVRLGAALDAADSPTTGHTLFPAYSFS